MPVNTEAPPGPQITERREVHKLGAPSWTVSEFDGGQRFLLVAYGPGTQVSVHFDAEGWRAFQDLVSPPQSVLGANGT